MLFLINGMNTPFLDNLMWTISETVTWTPFYLLCIWLLWFGYRRDFVKPFLFIFLAVLLANLISSDIIKPLIQRPRPTHTPEILGQLHLHVKPNGGYYYGGKYGFLSSHASNTCVVAILMFWFTKSYSQHKIIFGISLAAYTTIICYSRVYLCAHYPTDIIGGCLLGIIVSMLTIYFFRLYWNWSVNKSYFCNFLKHTNYA